jgi:hypothetical protein
MGNFGENKHMLSIKRPADFLAILLPIAWLMVFHAHILLNPGRQMLQSDGGDGIKNYFTLAWFVEHNESWTQFEGMHYPYGDLVVFTDNHPALGWTLKAIGVQGDNVVAVLNFIMLFSLVIACFFLYDSLKLLGVAPYLAGIGALLIAVSMPQWGRMAGHYSLSHLFMLPISCWLLLKYIKGCRGKWWILASVFTATLWFFTHPYIGLMASALAMGVQLFIWIKDRGKKIGIRLLHFVLQAILPIALFQGFVLMTDTHFDRPTDPAGFWEFMGHLESIFLPTHGPLAKHFYELFTLNAIEWETWAYLGVGSLLLIPLVVVWHFKEKKRWTDFFKSDPSQILLWASCLLLLFSLGWIFIWFPHLAEWLSPVKNFRVLARFAWPFVLIFNLVIFGKALSNWKAASGYYRIAVLLIIVAGFVEAADWHSGLLNDSQLTKNYFSESERDAYQNMIDCAEREGCAAIFSLPLFHVGSETFDTHTSDGLVVESMKVSYFTGLPLVSSMMSRTSVSETINILQLNAPYNYSHPIENLVDTSKPLLVVASLETMDERERALLSNAEILGVVNNVTFALLDWEQLFQQPISLNPESDSLSIEKVPAYFDAYQALTEPYNVMIKLEPGEIELGLYECSFWYKRMEQNRIMEAFVVQKDSQNGEIKWIEFDTINRSCLFSGDSIRYSTEFEIDDTTAVYHLMLTNNRNPITSVEVGHFLVRPSNALVLDTIGDNQLRVNNHVPIPLSEFELN